MLVDLIRSAIADRLTGNVGIVLSGGLDSSTVACLAPQNLPTFTGYYGLPGFDERRYAHLAAHPEHHDIMITPEDFVDTSTDGAAPEAADHGHGHFRPVHAGQVRLALRRRRCCRARAATSCSAAMPAR